MGDAENNIDLVVSIFLAHSPTQNPVDWVLRSWCKDKDKVIQSFKNQKDAVNIFRKLAGGGVEMCMKALVEQYPNEALPKWRIERHKHCDGKIQQCVECLLMVREKIGRAYFPKEVVFEILQWLPMTIPEKKKKKANFFNHFLINNEQQG